MTEPRSDGPTDEEAGAMSPEPTVPSADVGDSVEPTPAEREAIERRAFVRRMGSDAVRTAGSVFSLSRILTRTAVGVSQSVVGELERMGGGTPEAAEVATEAPEAVVARDEVAAVTAAAESAEPVSVGAAPPPPASPEVLIGHEERAVLEAARSAVIAVHREGFPPQLTTATVLWDGATLRFITLGWSRRTSMLRADPRIGVFVDGPGDGGFVTIAGRARIVEDRTVREMAWPVLLREAGDEAAAAARWDELVASDMDRAVIVVEPEQVLAGRR